MTEKNRLEPWYQRLWVRISLATALTALIVVLVWRTLRHGEDFLSSLDTEAEALRFQARVLQAQKKQAELSIERRRMAEEMARSLEKSKAEQARIETLDSTHVAAEWNRLRNKDSKDGP